MKQELLPEDKRFFNSERANADFSHWSKAQNWKLDEAVALAFGKEPKVVNWKTIEPLVRLSPFAKEYAEVRDLALRATAFGLLPDPVLPRWFLAWAERSEIDVPDELVREVHRGIAILAKSDRCEQMALGFARYLLKTDKVIVERNALIDKLQTQIRTHDSQETERLAESEGGKLLEMVYGMAIALGYVPGEQRQAATGTGKHSIRAKLERVGVHVHDDTIRKYVRQADDIFGEPN